MSDPTTPLTQTVEQARSGGHGTVVRLGWMQWEGKDRFMAMVEFPEAPPNLTCDVVFKALPVDIVPREQP